MTWTRTKGSVRSRTGHVVTSSPLRLSIAGGGTDLPESYAGTGARLLVAAVDRRVTVTVRHGRRPPDDPRPDGLVALFERRNSAHHVVSVTCSVSPGAGLGGSGALASALVAAESCLLGQSLSPLATGVRAYRWERDLLGCPVGFQDHLASALGGVNELLADPSGRIRQVPRPDLEGPLTDLLQDSLLLIDTRVRRRASILLSSLSRSLRQAPSSIPSLPTVPEWEDALRRRDVSAIGVLLRRQTRHKLATVPGAVPDDLGPCLADATDAGAAGYKIIGAGGGGFLLVAADPANRREVVAAFAAHGISPDQFRIEPSGVEAAWLAADDREVRR